MGWRQYPTMNHGDREEVSMILLSPKGSFQLLTKYSHVICDSPYFNNSYLKGLLPIFNECVDQFLERLRPLADGETQVPMKEEFAAVTMDIICKVYLHTWYTESPSGFSCLHATPQ